MKTDLIKGRLGRLKQLGTLLIYLAMVLIFTLLKPNYLTLTNFRSILIQAAMLGIISSGMTLVMMTGGVDMSVGAVAGVSTLAGMWPVVFDELPLAVGILIALGIALAFGLINGICISRLGIAPFVATLGTMFLAQGLQYLLVRGACPSPMGFPRPISSWVPAVWDRSPCRWSSSWCSWRHWFWRPNMPRRAAI